MKDALVKPFRTCRVPQAIIARAPGLLPMQYRPKELEAELGVSPLTIRDWVKKGLPCTRDRRGHLWINGEELAAWIRQQRKPRMPSRSGSDDAYCLRCRAIVKFQNPVISHTHGKQALLTGSCPRCGGKVNKGVRKNGQSA